MTSIRESKPSDVIELTDLFEAYRAFYKQEPNYDGTKSFMTQRSARKDSTIYVAELEGKLIGFAQLYPLLDSLKLGNLWLLNDLYVDPSSRGTGTGKKLLAQAKVLAEETNATGVLLETQKTNKVGNSLYPNQSWKFDDEFNHYVWRREKFESGTKDGLQTGLVKG